jgi:hypothetical protein
VKEVFGFIFEGLSRMTATAIFVIEAKLSKECTRAEEERKN